MKPFLLVLVLLAGCAPARIRWNYSAVPPAEQPAFNRLVQDCVKAGGDQAQCEHDILIRCYPDPFFVYDEGTHSYQSFFR